MPHAATFEAFRRRSHSACRLRLIPRTTFAAFGLAVLVLAASGCSHRPPQDSPPSPAEKAYLQNIQVTGAQMTAAKNFLQDTVITMHAQVSNKGTRTVRYIEMDLAFSNFMGQIDLREKANPVNANTPPLKPGETRGFEVSFDHMPGDWNQAPPQVSITRVVLAANQ